MHKEICEHIRKSVYSINVFLEEEKISSGTGFAISSKGELLTAGHVVTGRLPIKNEDVRDHKVKVFAKCPGYPAREYTPILCGITIVCDNFFTVPMQIDIALLTPKTNSDIEVPFLDAKIKSPRLGEKVLIAGFSDEVELPFCFDRHLKKDIRGIEQFLQAMDIGFQADMNNLMIKEGMVGNHRGIIFESSSSQVKVEGDFFYIDNGMHSGASGGPVVNFAGEAVGIITQRAITKVPYEDTPRLKVPSGATLGISLKPLLVINQKNH